ncbi:MAG: DUF2399 domain-containing protein [Anaerolineae bacterium]|nr:DUF2399 domain-containing protein [Anaerolineae bacterium]
MPAPFIPTADLATLIHLLLDGYERRGGAPQRAVCIRMDDVARNLAGYYSQADPNPRATTNEQLRELERRGLLALSWLPGQEGHLLDTVELTGTRVAPLYVFVKRESLSDQRHRLCTLLAGNRFRFDGWRRRAIDHTLQQIAACKSPTPFDLADAEWNQDLLDALAALPGDAREEIPYRVFSVRVFNDSKRFDTLKGAVARLARRHHAAWRTLSCREVLRELGLLPNPDHLYLYGPWQLVDPKGQIIFLSEFYPSVGIPTVLAAQAAQVKADAEHVICVENLTSFYSLVQHQGQGLAALCLWGNPSPASRHLLRTLASSLSLNIPLLLWADVDYGGLSILAQLREQVSPRFTPYCMDCATLDAHRHWAQPLTPADERNLARLRHHPLMSDVVALIDHMLSTGVKLEQEAVYL